MSAAIVPHSGLPSCERTRTDQGCYWCCTDCNYDNHRCHFCGEPTSHLGHVWTHLQSRALPPQPHLPEGYLLNRCYVPTVYTDGSSTGGIGDGGWAWVAYEGHSDEEISLEFGWDVGTTNQRMELMAALKAIEAFSTTGVHIVSDSAYLVNCFAQQWYIRWGAKDWRKVKNRDIWEPLITAVLEREPGREVQFEHIRGHQGIAGNERADELCGRARKEHLTSKLSVVEGTISASSTEQEQ